MDAKREQLLLATIATLAVEKQTLQDQLKEANESKDKFFDWWTKEKEEREKLEQQ